MTALDITRCQLDLRYQSKSVSLSIYLIFLQYTLVFFNRIHISSVCYINFQFSVTSIICYILLIASKLAMVIL